MTVLNVPNLITLSRIIMIPFIVGIFYFPDDLVSFSAKNLTATAIFIFAAVTDWLDGYLARRLNQISAFGAFLDPVADKLFVVGALVVLLFLGRVDALVGPSGRCPGSRSAWKWWAPSLVARDVRRLQTDALHPGSPG